MNEKTKARVEKLPKWAQDVIDELEQKIEDARADERAKLAFRFTPEVPYDLQPPSPGSGGKMIKGWDCNSYSQTVSMMCSSSIHHGHGWEGTSSQNPRAMYSTELLAWKALRHELEIEYSQSLADIDAKIENLANEPKNSDQEQ